MNRQSGDIISKFYLTSLHTKMLRNSFKCILIQIQYHTTLHMYVCCHSHLTLKCHPCDTHVCADRAGGSISTALANDPDFPRVVYCQPVCGSLPDIIKPSPHWQMGLWGAQQFMLTRCVISSQAGFDIIPLLFSQQSRVYLWRLNTCGGSDIFVLLTTIISKHLKSFFLCLHDATRVNLKSWTRD